MKYHIFGYALLFILLSVSVMAAPPLDYLSYLPMDGSSADFNSRITFTDTNIQYVNDALNKGAFFNITAGTSRMVNNSQPYQFLPNTSFTINMWLNKSDNRDGTFLIFTPGTSANYSRIQAVAGKYGVELWDGSANPNCRSSELWALNKSIMFTWVVNRSNNITTMYINSTQLCNTSISGMKPGMNYPTLILGRYFDGAAPYGGTIDEMTVYGRVLTTTEIGELWNGGTPPNMNSSTPSSATFITFAYQQPQTINFSSVVAQIVNVSYNATHEYATDTKLAYITNSTETPDSLSDILVNGTRQTIVNVTFTTNTSNGTVQSYIWRLLDNDILPATYNIEEDVMENLTHTPVSLTNANGYAAIELINVSNSTPFNIFEIMTNDSTGAPINVWYCNSSYAFSGNLVASPFCTQFSTIVSPNVYDHQHTTQSSHHNISVSIVNGNINTVKVSSTSYFLIQGNGGTVFVYTVANQSRATALRTTGNTGVTWSGSQATVDAHLHQATSSTKFTYQACTNSSDTNLTVCSDVRVSPVVITNTSPTTPIVLHPVNETVGSSVIINWTASTSPYSISNYQIRLFDIAFNFVKIIGSSATTSFTWNASSTANGNYTIGVIANNSAGITSSIGFGGEFKLDHTAPVCTLNSTVTGDLINLQTNCSSLYNPISITVACTDTFQSSDGNPFSVAHNFSGNATCNYVATDNMGNSAVYSQTVIYQNTNANPMCTLQTIYLVLTSSYPTLIPVTGNCSDGVALSNINITCTNGQVFGSALNSNSYALNQNFIVNTSANVPCALTISDAFRHNDYTFTLATTQSSPSPSPSASVGIHDQSGSDPVMLTSQFFGQGYSGWKFIIFIVMEMIICAALMTSVMVSHAQNGYIILIIGMAIGVMLGAFLGLISPFLIILFAIILFIILIAGRYLFGTNGGQSL